MSATPADVIDFLAGIEPGSPLSAVRDRRAQARENAQKSYLALFEPEVPGDVTALERYAIAAFVAGLHRQPVVSEYYAARLRDRDEAGIAQVISSEVLRAATEGPYGRYPEGPLTVEDVEGPDYRVSPASEAVLGLRLSAAFEHAHLLVFHPRDASPSSLQKLLDAGWSTTDIVTLSQLVSFLAFQIRVVAGLRTLAATSSYRSSALETVFTGVLASGHV